MAILGEVPQVEVKAIVRPLPAICPVEVNQGTDIEGAHHWVVVPEGQHLISSSPRRDAKVVLDIHPFQWPLVGEATRSIDTAVRV